LKNQAEEEEDRYDMDSNEYKSSQINNTE